MAGLSELITPKKLLIGGLLTLEIILSACGNTPAKSTLSLPIPSPTQNPKADCQELKRKEFVPYGGSFVIKDFYHGELTDIVIVQVPTDYRSTRTLIMNVLVETITNYPYIISNVTEDGMDVTHGPERCFEELDLQSGV